MQRGSLMTWWIAALVLAAQLHVQAQSSAHPSPVLPPVEPAPTPVVLSKEAIGPLLRDILHLTLRSNAASDATQTLIPDGSTLESDSFTITVDGHGNGTFRGGVRIVTPDGQPIVSGILHGTVGLTSHREASAADRALGHLEGILEAPRFLPPWPIPLAGAPTGRSGGPGAPSAVIYPITGPAPLLEVSFSADELPTAGIMPLYAAHLDGLIALAPRPLPTPTPAPGVRVQPSKLHYRMDESITATVSNGSDHTVRIFDEESFCSIVQMQQQTGSGWQLIGPCPLDRAPFPILVRRGATLRIVLPPPGGPVTWGGGAASTGGAGPGSGVIVVPGFTFAPGTYRLAVTYAPVDTSGNPGGDRTVTSARFTVDTPSAGGAVTVTTNRHDYDVADAIGVLIRNQTSRGIATFDHQSYCTIVTLQRRSGGEWLNVAPCLRLTPTRQISIGAGQSTSVTLPPEPATPHREPGTYRVEFVFSPAGGPPADSLTLVDSPPFVIARNVTH